MSLPGVGNPVRSKLRDGSIWHTEMTFAAADSEPTLDSSTSDTDERVPTPVAKTATGVIALKFPKCTRARVIGKNLSPGTPDTEANFKAHEIVSLDADAGTAEIRFITLDGTPAPVDPSASSRYSVTLLLEAE